MEGATWAAFGMSIISMIGTAVAAVNARQVARDKLEFERAAARDKMEFDAKTRELETKVALFEHELSDCRKQHVLSETDRAELRRELDALGVRLAEIQAAEAEAKAKKGTA